MVVARRFACVVTAVCALGVWSVVSSPAVGAAASQKPTRGGTITITNPADTPSLDTTKLSGFPGVVFAQLVYGTLISVDPVTLKPVMRLAQSLASSPDAKVWTVKLRPGLTFSDGTPLNAAAVVANWDRHKVPGLGSQCFTTVSGMGTYVAQDTTTVVVTLPEARVGFPTQLAGCLSWIASPAAVAKAGDAYGTTAASVSGAGPYLIKEWMREDHMTMVRSPGYWDKPRPYIDTIIQKPVQDQSQSLSAFQSGAADVMNTTGLSESLAAAQKSTGATLYNYAPTGGGIGVKFNLSTPGLNDVRIRKALVLATDPKDLNQKATGGAADMVDTFFVKGSPQYNPKVRQNMNNLKEAQKLVDEYTAQHGPLDFTFSVYQGGANWGTAQAQQWSRLKGITIKLDIISATQALVLFQNGNYQMIVQGVTGSDPERFYTQLFSTSKSNVTHYSNPTVDAALTQLRSETNPKKQYELYTTMSKQWLDDAPAVLWYRAALPAIIRKGIANVQPYANSPIFDYAQAWVARS